MSWQRDEHSAADIAAVGPDDEGADTLRGGLLYHCYYINGAWPSEPPADGFLPGIERRGYSDAEKDSEVATGNLGL